MLIKAQEVSFAAGMLSGKEIKPVVSLTGLYYSGAPSAEKYPFGELLQSIHQELSNLENWKDTV